MKRGERRCEERREERGDVKRKAKGVEKIGDN